MATQIREYRADDKPRLVRFMEELQDYLVAIDDKKRLKRMPGYGESYTQRLLRKIEENEGIIYIAERKGKPVGLVVASMCEQSEEDLLEAIPIKEGRIQELIIDPEYRRQAVGAMLVKKAEQYLERKGCGALNVEVFGPNVKARSFYRKLGYQDRVVDMIKLLPGAEKKG